MIPFKINQKIEEKIQENKIEEYIKNFIKEQFENLKIIPNLIELQDINYQQTEDYIVISANFNLKSNSEKYKGSISLKCFGLETGDLLIKQRFLEFEKIDQIEKKEKNMGFWESDRTLGLWELKEENGQKFFVYKGPLKSRIEKALGIESEEEEQIDLPKVLVDFGDRMVEGVLLNFDGVQYEVKIDGKVYKVNKFCIIPNSKI